MFQEEAKTCFWREGVNLEMVAFCVPEGFNNPLLNPTCPAIHTTWDKIFCCLVLGGIWKGCQLLARRRDFKQKLCSKNQLSQQLRSVKWQCLWTSY